jgi:hypothetical protein
MKYVPTIERWVCNNHGANNGNSGTPEWNTFIPSCGVPVDKYFWLNDLHPTHLVHKTTAKELAKVL